jgi:hypothetical protein
MPLYTAFRLNIQSEFLLPELTPGSGAPDVTIRRAILDSAPSEETPIECIHASQTEALLSWGKVGVALIKNGSQILFDPAPGVHEDTIRLFLSGAALGVLLHQRGTTVMHASAVLVHGKVVAFIGDKGAGKSSTAAALCARGHALMSDDLLAIRFDPQGKALVAFSYPQIKLWPDTVETLGMEPANLARIRPEIDKRLLQSDLLDPLIEYPLHTIFVLGIGENTGFFPLPPQAALFSLVRNIYVSRFGKAFYQPEMSPTPFEQAADVLHKVPVTGLKRKIDLSALPAIAQLIEESLIP